MKLEWLKKRMGAQYDRVQVIQTATTKEKRWSRKQDRYVNGKTFRHALLWVDQTLHVWKKVNRYGSDGVVIKLSIPPGAIVAVHENNPKCRANVAYVDRHDKGDVYSMWVTSFRYESESIAIPFYSEEEVAEKFFVACGTGIHFFFYVAQAKRFHL